MRPPLAKDLFSPRDSFRNTMRQYEKCFDVLPKIEKPLENSTVEHELEELQRQAEAAQDPERLRQLASVRFYLRDMIWDCVAKWKDLTRGASNYKALLDSIRSANCQDKTCLVTFNYDVMLEDALRSQGIVIQWIENYVDGSLYKTIKLHGSVTWVHPALAHFEGPVQLLDDSMVGRVLIDQADRLRVSDDLFKVVDHPLNKIGDTIFFPALAIPTETKLGFECPKEHIEILTKHLTDVTKIIIIGWAANEKNFLQLLAKNINGAPKTVIVAGSIQGGNEIKEKLIAAGIKGQGPNFTNISVTQSGFSDFVRGEADRFLSA